MKILILHSRGIKGYPSGEEKVARDELEQLLNSGVDAKLVLFGPDVLLETGWKQNIDLKISAVAGALWSFNAYNRVRSEIVRFKPDVVHFHGLMPFLSISALAAAYDCNVPAVQTLHNGRWLCVEGGFYRDGKLCVDCVGGSGWRGVARGCNRGHLVSAVLGLSSFNSRVNHRLFKWIDTFIAVSEFIKDAHIASGFPADKIVVKNNSIKMESLNINEAKDKRRNGLAYISRISKSKGSDVIKKIIAEVQTQIHIVGDGPDLLSLQSYCKQGGYEHVVFWGRKTREECFRIMSTVECVVIPSQCGEAFPLVAVESLSLGTPVIGSDVGGLGQLLRTSAGGIFVTPTDIQGFFNGIRRLQNDRALARRYGETGQDYAKKHLSVSENSRQLHGIYLDVINRKFLQV